MRHEKVDGMLKAYRFDVGRCGHLQTEIARLKKDIAHAMETLVQEAATVPSGRISGMPRGTTVGNPTERTAVLLASGWVPDTVKEMQQELKTLQIEFAERNFTVLFVSSWLQGLAGRERWIIEHQVIDGETWRDIGTSFRIAFGEAMSKDSLKRLKWRALQKVYQMAE